MKTDPLYSLTSPGALNTKTLFYSDNPWGIPLLKTTEFVPKWLAPYKTRFRSRRQLDLTSGAYHFFLPPRRFTSAWCRPTFALESIKRLGAVLSPAFPLEGTKSEQLFATYQNRWCGAWWQSRGLIVIPSVLWRGEESYELAFAGVSKGSVVAITARNWRDWPDGFTVMMTTLNPVKVLCFGEPEKEEPTLVSYPEKFHLKLVSEIRRNHP